MVSEPVRINRFLIVDDLRESRAFLQRLLTRHFPDAEVCCVDNGEEGLKKAREMLPDLMLLDAVMPGLSGFDVCAALKADPRTAGILVLMVSALLVTAKDRISGLEGGADSYICKPFENEELIAQARALLRIRHAEQALQHRQQLLERELTARQRIERELQKARVDAESAARVKAEFLAHMSHEIRTPMNAVIGMTSLLAHTPLNDEQRDFVRTIVQSGESLLAIINDILDLSKIESGRMVLDREEFDVAACVGDVLDLLGVKAREKGIELTCQVDEQAPRRVQQDYERLRQVLVNLIGNAIKFTDRGEVSVKVRPVESEDERFPIGLLFSVRDTGIGIPQDRLGSLFQAFSQVDASSTRRYMGTGLGLAISKKLVHLMGGQISATSAEGKGSTFSFTIHAAPAASQPDPEAPPIPLLRGLRMLLVDDLETNRRMIRTAAERYEMKVAEASSGAEALRLLDRKVAHYDLLVVDVEMPGMDGITLLRTVRSLPGWADTPVLLVTSRDLQDAKQAVRDLDASACLQKPVKPDVLMQTIRRLLGRTLPSEESRKALPVDALDPELARNHPLSILVAEDNPVNRKVVLLLLQRLGYRADYSVNGKEALAALEKQPYDVVLMDGQMPEMDGYEATLRIRESFPGDRQPYIVAMTADAMAEDREHCFAVGMDAYVAKPVRIEDIVHVLERASARKTDAGS